MGDPQDFHSYAEVAITLAGLTGIIGAIQNRSDPFEVCHLSVQNTVRLLCVAPVCQHGKVFTSTETEDKTISSVDPCIVSEVSVTSVIMGSQP